MKLFSVVRLLLDENLSPQQGATLVSSAMTRSQFSKLGSLERLTNKSGDLR